VNYFNYFSEIEETFVRRRGKHLFLSPLDWALIETWQERGIPLHIVIRGIESVFDVFDRQPPGTRTIKSLFYCREEIEAQYTEWSRSMAGKGEESDLTPNGKAFPSDAVRSHIEGSIEQLKALELPSLQEDVDRATSRLEELLANLAENGEIVDSTLADIEKLLLHSMLTNWDRVHLNAIEKEMRSQLREYKADMDEAAYKQTYDLLLAKRLRDEAGLPRLGLYYL
jgi:hypothetical protein